MAYQAYTKMFHDIIFAILYLIKDNAIRVVKLQKKKKKKKKTGTNTKLTAKICVLQETLLGKINIGFNE